MRKKELLMISIAIFLTVIAWLVADIYHAATAEKIKEQVPILKIKNYDMGMSILEELRNKK